MWKRWKTQNEPVNGMQSPRFLIKIRNTFVLSSVLFVDFLFFFSFYGFFSFPLILLFHILSLIGLLFSSFWNGSQFLHCSAASMVSQVARSLAGKVLSEVWTATWAVHGVILAVWCCCIVSFGAAFIIL